MLILSRRENQSIVIGSGEEKIRIIVTYIGSDVVKIGVDAPKSIPVHREEVIQAVSSSNKQALVVGPIEALPNNAKTIFNAYTAAPKKKAASSR